MKEIGKQLGRKFTGKHREELHREVHGQNYNYQEIVKEGYCLFK